MNLAFHTEPLEDKTLGIVRAHNAVMRDLLRDGFEKKEAREDKFAEVMSSEFVTGLDTKAQGFQAAAVEKFNEMGTEIMKTKNKFSAISLDDKMKIQEGKQELIAVQERMQTTIDSYLKAKDFILKDMGKKLDVDESIENIDREFKNWDGEKALGLESFLVPAYENLGVKFIETAKAIPWGSEDVLKDQTKDIGGGVRKTDYESIKWRQGLETEQSRREFLISYANQPETKRSSNKFYKELESAGSEETKDQVRSVQRQYIFENYSEDVARTLTAITIGAKVDLEALMRQDKTGKKERPTSTSGRGTPSQEIPTTGTVRRHITLEDEEVDGKVKGWAFDKTPIPIHVDEGSMTGLAGKYKPGAYKITVTQVLGDGTVHGTYVGQGGQDVIPSVYYVPVGGNKEESKALALTVYNKMLGAVEDVVEGDGVWLPYGKENVRYTVRLKIDLNHIDPSDDEYDQVAYQLSNQLKDFKTKFPKLVEEQNAYRQGIESSVTEEDEEAEKKRREAEALGASKRGN